jgi:hypothetical protein
MFKYPLKIQYRKIPIFRKFPKHFIMFVMFVLFSLFNFNPPPPSIFSKNLDVKQTIKLERPNLQMIKIIKKKNKGEKY